MHVGAPPIRRVSKDDFSLLFAFRVFTFEQTEESVIEYPSSDCANLPLKYS